MADQLLTYVPASIVSFIKSFTAEHKDEVKSGSDFAACVRKQPLIQRYSSCVLFADVSGFTKMCEALAAHGEGGNEALAKHLNSYFEMLVRIVAATGGDVFKYAGDAMIVIWPPTEESLENTTRRAAQCALEISGLLQEATLAEGVRLSVKIGIGV
jgi:class 3 adenylate cyclase